MRALTLTLAVLTALWGVSFAPPAKAQPWGSFRQSCRDIRTNGWTLWARCSSRWGWRTTSIDYRTCNGDIANQNGYLVCTSRPGPLPFPLPGPGYDDDDYDNGRPGWNDGRPGWGYGDLTLFAGQGFSGPAMTVRRDAFNLDRRGFNDMAQSVRITGGVWQLCEHASFGGRCITLSRSASNLWRFGMGRSVSSVRRLR